MTDTVFSAYVDWREQCRRVHAAYARWCGAHADESVLRFAAYAAELDREQRACDAFAASIGSRD
jgi:hypothetical protein